MSTNCSDKWSALVKEEEEEEEKKMESREQYSLVANKEIRVDFVAVNFRVESIDSSIAENLIQLLLSRQLSTVTRVS